MDVCVGYQVNTRTSGGISVFSLYGIYECSQDGTMVTFTDYGTDSTCNTVDSTNDKTIPFDDTLAAGTIGTFNCDGGNICSDDGGDYADKLYGITPTTFATGVCVYGEIEGNSGYTSATCDATGSTATIYSDDSCSVSTGETSDELSASATCCSRLGDARDQETIYQRQTNCVLSTDPPREPTEATDVSVCAATDKPTEDIASEEGKGFMFIVDYVVLLIIGMTIFVN